MDREALKRDLKELIVVECQKNHVQPEQIGDDDVLIGSGGDLGLDSLDALQIALAVKKKYGKRIDGGRATRMALKSVNSLADFILAD